MNTRHPFQGSRQRWLPAEVAAQKFRELREFLRGRAAGEILVQGELALVIDRAAAPRR